MDYENEKQIVEQETVIERSSNRGRTIMVVLALCLVLALSCLTTWFVTATFYETKYAGDFSVDELSNVIEDQEALEKFLRQYALLKDSFYFGATDAELLEGAMRGMASGLGDIYTMYYTDEEYQEFYSDMSGSYAGIGVSVTMGADNLLTILKVFDGSPAEVAGMMKGDQILKVGDQDVTSGYTSNEIVPMIKGEPGTSVSITFYRPSTEETFVKDVLRAEITNYTVTYEMLEGDIGYIQISSFDANVDTLFKSAMDTVVAQGAKGVIIDLRDNGGGYLAQTLNMADMLVPKNSLMLTLKYADGTVDEYKSWSAPSYTDIEIVVLVNEYSASASEVFSGILKDHGRAKIVGVTTFGKGIVQNVATFEDGSAVKLTIASYFTPDGYEIHGNGITPDVEEKIDPKYELYSPSVIPEGCDNQLNKAVDTVKGMINGN